MAHLIRVGEAADGCTMETVISTMSKSSNFHALRSKWLNLASELGVTLDAKSFAHIKWPAYPTRFILNDLLNNWKEKHSNKATLDKLIMALEKCGLTDLAENLQNKFCLANCVRSKTTKHRNVQPACSKSLRNDSVEQTDGNPSTWFSKSTLSKFTDDDIASRTIQAGSDLNVSVKQNFHSKVKLGCALILNVLKYKNSTYRHGAQYDSNRMKQLLVQLGYQLLVYDDVNAEYTFDDVCKIINIFKAEIRKQKNPTSILVFVGSHGKLNNIILSDGTKMNIYENIVYQFAQDKCPELNDTPKIFIFQCCRSPVKTDSGYTNITKTLICYATLPNNVALRKEHKGSPYIESLVRIFCEHARCRHLKEMMDMVEEDLEKEIIECGGETPGHVQQPTYESFGQFRDFYFMQDQ